MIGTQVEPTRARPVVIVRLQPLTAELVSQLAELARTDFSRVSVERFAAERGWDEEWGRFHTESGHQVVPEIPMEVDAEHQTGLRITFCLYDPEEDIESNDLSEEWFAEEFWPDGGLEGWDILATTSSDPFREGWQHGHDAVAAALGAPDVTVVQSADGRTGSPDEDRHFAAWHVGATVLVVAQSEAIDTFGNVSMAAIWLVRHEAAKEIPADGAEFYSWLLGQGQYRRF